MSARKVQNYRFVATSSPSKRGKPVLSLSPDSVIIHKNGIEFRSATPFSEWTEMTITLQSPGDAGRVHCTGVVVACTGNRHAGYHVSMVFTSLSKQAQARLSTLAFTPLGYFCRLAHWRNSFGQRHLRHIFISWFPAVNRYPARHGNISSYSEDRR